MATRLLAAVLLGWLWVGWGWVRTAYAADTRPIEQLPKDIFRISTLWAHIPQGMADVGREEGVASALVWGPARGAAVMMQKTSDEIWSTVKPNQKKRRGERRNEPAGVILRYEF
jgi:hypothetical protein